MGGSTIKWKNGAEWTRQEDSGGKNDQWKGKSVYEVEATDDSQKDAWSQKEWSADKWSAKGDRDVGEKVQRWLGHILKRGYKDLDIELVEGKWAELKKLVEILNEQKPEWGISDENGLRSLLEEGDKGGRFGLE